MSGYGLAPYGLGLYGYSTPPPSLVENFAYATGTRVVRVTLSAEPMHQNALGNGDALNPATWTISTTGGQTWPILSVALVDDFTFDILVLGALPNFLTSLTLATSTLVTVTGFPFPALVLPFQGCGLAATSTYDKQNTASGYAVQDLRNSVGVA